jgi:photosystem II stability/assembly factor-like uncharacterized protein
MLSRPKEIKMNRLRLRSVDFCVRLAVAALIFVCGGAAAFAQQYSQDLFSDMKWRVIGPFRGGRTVAVSGVPSQPSVFYMAPNNGGVWKTTDFGLTWKPIFDGQPTGSIGALAVAPSDPNVIYVGSGEGLQRPDLSTGDGIYKSTDAGATWQHLGLREGRQIGALVVDPRDANRLFVAVLGHPYGPNEERGVYRSTDGGQTFERVLYKDEDTGAIALAMDSLNPQVIYADLWAARQAPWEYGNEYQGPGSGLYKSTDGGNTWKQLGGGLPTRAEQLGRIGIAIAPSDSGRLYAWVNSSSKTGGIYRSDDAGENWERLNSETRVWERGDDFSGVTVDPMNKDVVYIANTSTYRSTDGGKSFTAIKGAPGGDDYHTIWINPANPQIILLGLDQGATISVNGGQTWSSWYNQPTAQLYHVAADNRYPYWVYGGQQESGSAGVATRGNWGQITMRDWHTVGLDEYGYAAPDPLHPGVIFGSKGTRFDEKTGQTQDVSPFVVRTEKYRFDRTAPIIFSPVDPHILYFGAQVLFKTLNGGQSWEVISPDLSRKDAGVPATLGIYSPDVKGVHRGVIYSIAPSPKDVNLIWVGTSDGLVHVTSDAGKTWADVTPKDLTPWSKISQMDASHFDAAEAFASVSRLRLDDLHPYIFRTRDSGKSWQKIVKGLPDDAPVDVVREDPARKGLLFAGTELAVYVSFDDGDNWQSLQLNLPHTSMRDLIIHGDDIVVATHGRSFWVLDDITPLRQLTDEVAKANSHLFRPQTAIRVRRSTSTDTPLPPEEPAGQNPPDGAIIDYFLTPAAAGPVTLQILDAAGKVVRQFASTDKPDAMDQIAKEIPVPIYWVRETKILSAKPGMHRFVWDFHAPSPDSVNHEYPISANFHDTPQYPQGATVPPGAYTVKLTAGGKSFTQPLVVKMDPRVTTLPAGIAQQYALASRITKAMGQSFRALEEVKKLQEQLKKIQQGTGDAAPPKPIADAIAALEKKAAPLLGGSREEQFAAFLGGRAVPSLSSFNGQLAQLLGVVDGADAAPTTQAVTVTGEVQQALDKMLARWSELKSQDVAALSKQLTAAHLPAITLDAAAPAEKP